MGRCSSKHTKRKLDTKRAKLYHARVRHGQVYGMLLESVQHFVQTHYGEDTWCQVLEAANLHTTVFMTHKRYSDNIMLMLAESCAHVIGQHSSDHWMHYFGQCFVEYFTHYGYDKILRVSGRHFRDFLHGIDNLHETMRFSYPKMCSPSFYVQQEDAHGCLLHYQSRRVGFTQYVVGQLKQCAKNFYNVNLDVKVLREDVTANGSHVIYQLKFNNAPFLETIRRRTTYPGVLKYPKMSASTYFKLFPFVLVFNQSLIVTHAGETLQHLIQTDSLIGRPLTQVFRLRRPLISFTWENIFCLQQVVFEMETLKPVKFYTYSPSAPSTPRTPTPPTTPDGKTASKRAARCPMKSATLPEASQYFTSSGNHFQAFANHLSTPNLNHAMPSAKSLATISSGLASPSYMPLSNHLAKHGMAPGDATNSVATVDSANYNNQTDTTAATSMNNNLDKPFSELPGNANTREYETAPSLGSRQNSWLNGDFESPEGGGRRLLLKGQMRYVKDLGGMMYLCSPLIDSLEDMQALGLYINDLNMYDTSREMVMAGSQRASLLEYSIECQVENSEKITENLEQLESWRERSDSLLYSMIPQEIANRLKQGEDPVNTCESFDNVTILFGYLLGFNEICEEVSALELVEYINSVFLVFDAIVDKYRVFKVETLGDAVYMVAGGIPTPSTDHAERIANVALEFVEKVKQVVVPGNKALEMRAGIHTGSVVAGVVGKRMPQYCLFGDTVNTASRMQTYGEAGQVHISESCQKCLVNTDLETVFRGKVNIKGKGEMATFWLVGHKNDLDLSAKKRRVTAAGGGNNHLRSPRPADMYDLRKFHKQSEVSLYSLVDRSECGSLSRHNSLSGGSAGIALSSPGPSVARLCDKFSQTTLQIDETAEESLQGESGGDSGRESDRGSVGLEACGVRFDVGSESDTDSSHKSAECSLQSLSGVQTQISRVFEGLRSDIAQTKRQMRMFSKRPSLQLESIQTFCGKVNIHEAIDSQYPLDDLNVDDQDLLAPELSSRLSQSCPINTFLVGVEPKLPWNVSQMCQATCLKQRQDLNSDNSRKLFLAPPPTLTDTKEYAACSAAGHMSASLCDRHGRQTNPNTESSADHQTRTQEHCQSATVTANKI